MSKITVHAPDLLRAVKLVKHAAAKREDRPIIATILLEGDADGFRLVAADNYRIGIATVEALGDTADFGRVPLPIGEVPVVEAVLTDWHEAVEIEARDEHLTFTTKTRTATVRTMSGTYPKYDTVLAGDRSTLGVNLAFLAHLGRATKDARARLFVGAWNTPIEIEVPDLDYREYIMPIRLEEHTPAAIAAITRPEEVPA